MRIKDQNYYNILVTYHIKIKIIYYNKYIIMNAQTWALTFGIGAFVFWQPATTLPAIQETYKQRSKNVSIAPPSW